MRDVRAHVLFVCSNPALQCGFLHPLALGCASVASCCTSPRDHGSAAPRRLFPLGPVLVLSLGVDADLRTDFLPNLFVYNCY